MSKPVTKNDENIHLTGEIFDIARRRFEELARTLVRKGSVTEYHIQDNIDGVKITLHRSIDDKTIEARVLPTGEVFDRRFDGSYETFRTAYDLQSKRQELAELLEDIILFAETLNYTEELYQFNGKTVFQKIVFPNGAFESSSPVFAGRLLRFLGTTKQTKKY